MVITLVVVGGAVAVAGVLVKLLYDRHSATQLARMNAVTDTPAPPPVTQSPDDPYRSPSPREREPPREPTPEEELARLAAEGQRRANAETTQRDSELKRHLEWVRLHRLCGAMRLLPEGPYTNISESLPAEVLFPRAGVSPGYGESYAAPPPLPAIESATRKAHAEAAWLKSLPFPIDGYFSILADDPLNGKIAINSFCLSVAITLVDAANIPRRDILEGLLHGHDPKAVVMSAFASPVVVQSRELTAVSAQQSYSTENIPPYIHGFVDKVLLPLHRARPIARVSLERV